jgi:hypothetical protein
LSAKGLLLCPVKGHKKTDGTPYFTRDIFAFEDIEYTCDSFGVVCSTGYLGYRHRSPRRSQSDNIEEFNQSKLIIIRSKKRTFQIWHKSRVIPKYGQRKAIYGSVIATEHHVIAKLHCEIEK